MTLMWKGTSSGGLNPKQKLQAVKEIGDTKQYRVESTLSST